jgi:hypothetical protein
MLEIIKQTVADNAEAEIVNNVNTMLENGNMDKLINQEVKTNETFWDKLLNLFITN